MKAKSGELREVDLVEGVSSRFFSGERMMFSLVRIEPGVLLPEHSHPHEQMGYVLAGSLTLMAEGEELFLEQGDVYRLAGGSLHWAFGGSDGALVLDVFSPPREDYLAMVK